MGNNMSSRSESYYAWISYETLKKGKTRLSESSLLFYSCFSLEKLHLLKWSKQMEMEINIIITVLWSSLAIGGDK